LTAEAGFLEVAAGFLAAAPLVLVFLVAIDPCVESGGNSNAPAASSWPVAVRLSETSRQSPKALSPPATGHWEL
jgi:hypothetical protein